MPTSEFLSSGVGIFHHTQTDTSQNQHPFVIYLLILL